MYVLKKIPLFASLSEADLQNLTSLLRRKQLGKGELLFQQGDEGTALYIIAQGRIKISLSRRMDNVTLAILGQGEFLGEMALLDDLPRSADAIALEDSLLYVLNRKDFLSFLSNNGHTVYAILTSLSLRLRKTDDQLGRNVLPEFIRPAGTEDSSNWPNSRHPSRTIPMNTTSNIPTGVRKHPRRFPRKHQQGIEDSPE